MNKKSIIPLVFSRFIKKLLFKLAYVKTSIAILIILIIVKPILVDILSLPITNLIIVFMIFKIVSKLLNLDIKQLKISKFPEINKRNLGYLFMFIAMFLLTIGVLFFVNYRNSNIPKCLSPYEIKSTLPNSEIIKICDNILYANSIKIVSEKEFPDLFNHHYKNDDKLNEVKQYIRVFEKDNQEYISVKSEFDQVSLVDSAIGIYRKENDKYNLVFKRTFDDNQGRWVNIEFGEDYSSRDPLFYLTSHGKGFSISGDIGYLGCVGACRLLWWDYYDWDSNKKTFVLENNKHTEQFKRLLDNYEEMDKDTCPNEANVSESISNLYQVRKNKEKICSDNAEEPATTIGQAEMLLKGKKAIELILAGENISMSQVKNVKIN